MGTLVALGAIFCIALVALGFAWCGSNPVSAGRPGSLLILMGALGVAGCGAAWWLS